MEGGDEGITSYEARSRALNLRGMATALAACVPNGTTVACVRSHGASQSATLQLPLDDPLFTVGKHSRSPVMALCGVPLAVVRTRGRRPNDSRVGESSNQLACYFMVEPRSGMARRVAVPRG